MSSDRDAAHEPETVPAATATADPAADLSPDDPTPSRAERAVGLAVALGGTAMAFLPSIGFAFVNWDDDFHVYRNPLLEPGAAISELLRTRALGYPVPVTVLSYKLERALFGLDPRAFHATNVALHLGSVALVFSLALALRMRAAAACLAAVLFGLCPVVAEPVSWVSGRKDVLAAVLLLAALRVRAPARAHPEAAPPRGALAASLALALLAMLAKPSALCAPLLVFAHEVFSQRAAPRVAARRALPYALLAGPVAIASVLGQRAVNAVTAPVGPLRALRQAWYALGYHLGLVLGLQPSCMKHIPAQMPPAFEARVDLLPLAVLPALWLVVRATPEHLRGRARFALAFAFAAYLPASNLVPLVRYLAETYAYLPLVGLALFAAGAFDAALRRRARATGRASSPLGFALAAACALALLPATLRASSKWVNGVALWSDAYARYPDSPQVCRGVGNARYLAGEFGPALAQYDRCVADFGPALFRHNRALTLRALGRAAEADAIEPAPAAAPSAPARSP